MSYALDVNVLLYAVDEESPHHPRAREFLDRCAAGPEVCCLGWLTIMSFLRMATNPRIFGRPLTPEAAEGNVSALLALPHVRALSEQDGFWEVYRRVTAGLAVRGNLVPDAHLAALLVQHGVTVLYTRDADFRKFQDLQVRDPFAGNESDDSDGDDGDRVDGDGDDGDRDDSDGDDGAATLAGRSERLNPQERR